MNGVQLLLISAIPPRASQPPDELIESWPDLATESIVVDHAQ